MKLAQFVARNGPEFEEMTKQKQMNNPKFEFLFGGPFHQYYICQVKAQHAGKLFDQLASTETSATNLLKELLKWTHIEHYIMPFQLDRWREREKEVEFGSQFKQYLNAAIQRVVFFPS